MSEVKVGTRNTPGIRIPEVAKPTVESTLQPVPQPENAFLHQNPVLVSLQNTPALPVVQDENPALRREVELQRRQHVSNTYRPAPSWEDIENGSKSLKRGQMGAAVEALQNFLTDTFRGFSVESLTPDAKFGPKTEAVLREYQRSRGLPATGQVDANVLKAMTENRPALEGWTPRSVSQTQAPQKVRPLTKE